MKSEFEIYTMWVCEGFTPVVIAQLLGTDKEVILNAIKRVHNQQGDAIRNKRILENEIQVLNIEISALKKEISALRESPYNKEIHEYDMSARLYNCLTSENIVTFFDLIRYSEQDLLKIPNMGRKSLKELKDLLVTQGLYISNGVKVDSDKNKLRTIIRELETLL